MRLYMYEPNGAMRIHFDCNCSCPEMHGTAGPASCMSMQYALHFAILRTFRLIFYCGLAAGAICRQTQAIAQVQAHTRTIAAQLIATPACASSFVAHDHTTVYCVCVCDCLYLRVRASDSKVEQRCAFAGAQHLHVHSLRVSDRNSQISDSLNHHSNFRLFAARISIKACVQVCVVLPFSRTSPELLNSLLRVSDRSLAFANHYHYRVT